jgi:hypothetical protein
VLSPIATCYRTSPDVWMRGVAEGAISLTKFLEKHEIFCTQCLISKAIWCARVIEGRLLRCIVVLGCLELWWALIHIVCSGCAGAALLDFTIF